MSLKCHIDESTEDYYDINIDRYLITALANKH